MYKKPGKERTQIIEGEGKLFLYADDMILPVENMKEFREVLELTVKFSQSVEYEIN